MLNDNKHIITNKINRKLSILFIKILLLNGQSEKKI